MGEKHVDNWGDLKFSETGNPFEDARRNTLIQLNRNMVLVGGWEVERAEYDTRAGRLSDTAPMIVATETVRNNSDSPQTSDVNLSQSVSETHSFSFTAGFSIEVGTTISAGIPLVVDGQVQTKLTAKMDFTWGHSKTVTTTVGNRVAVQAAPNSTVRVTGSMKRSKVDVPCTLYLRSTLDRTVTTHSKVVYHGLTYWDFEVDYERV
ncbi:hypothetical protein POX_b03363 [Penicillium oxalicum]|uniref:Uncharacterized protein n=1 Tax=Penicillium oxalicum (strain 114-2 / CGMCC 5302) TaxID=933388 RepID=S8ATY6_PENO1|nr:hypothetical protein POX_b03363 [Penicillium oxalicum]EPS29613.1 hypothetical protein PDE_04563 [Penicillium oxalicum 114-2]KAI2793309.1 hypothetical protein POX_b03363 [Penicillium oxalicum]